jgi:hypothetical protein
MPHLRTACPWTTRNTNQRALSVKEIGSCTIESQPSEAACGTKCQKCKMVSSDRVRIAPLKYPPDSPAQPEIPSHSRPAPARTIHGLYGTSSCRTTVANPARPMQPSAAPAASSAAASRPRTMPHTPARFFFCFSRFSISVALAGKIAGKARKSPPILAHKRWAIEPAVAVISPSNKNRVAYSCHLVVRSPARSIRIIICRLLFRGQKRRPASQDRCGSDDRGQQLENV